MYKAKVVCDSISPSGMRLTSAIIEFPRIVLAETVTHRRLSISLGVEEELIIHERNTSLDITKNSASSRAIPFPKMLEKLRNDPFEPSWTLNQRGMQGGDITDEGIIRRANELWWMAKERNIEIAEELSTIGIHKQNCNRLLEPFSWVTQLITADQIGWNNFFNLRCHKAAQPEFRKVARMLYIEMKQSTPSPLDYGQWHLPFVKPEEKEGFNWMPDTFFMAWMNHKSFTLDDIKLPDLIKFSAARCAWVSYNNHDQEDTPEKMLGTFNKLIAEIPVHASPIEAQATPLHPSWEASFPKVRSNLRGWLQARKLIPMEELKEFNPSEEEIALWKKEGDI